MTTGIYGIFCTANSKVYVGKSCNIEERLLDHRAELKNNRHRNSHLQAAWSRYGESEFLFCLIESCDRDALNEHEVFWIRYLGTFENGFNQTAGGDGGLKNQNFLGKAHSEETKRKIGDASKGRKHSPEVRMKMRHMGNQYRRNIPHSEESRQKISTANKGKKRSDESRRKISEALKGKPKSEEHRRKCSDWQWGRTLSPESVLKREATRRRNWLLKKAEQGLLTELFWEASSVISKEIILATEG